MGRGKSDEATVLHIVYVSKLQFDKTFKERDKKPFLLIPKCHSKAGVKLTGKQRNLTVTCAACHKSMIEISLATDIVKLSPCPDHPASSFRLTYTGRNIRITCNKCDQLIKVVVPYGA